MPAGVWIENDARSIQIDENYRNLCLTAKGTTRTTDRGGFRYPFVDLSVTGTMPVLALRCATAPAMVSGVSFSNGVWSHRIFAGQQLAEPGADLIEYFVFDVPPPTPSSGYGLIVRDEQRRIAFDSGRKYLRVIDFFSHEWFSDGVSHTYPPGRTYAFIFSKPNWGMQLAPYGPNPGAYVELYGGTGFQNNGSSIVSEFMHIFEIPRPEGSGIVNPSNTPNGQITVIDVTHY